jgi:hypothetical protein
MSQGIDLTFIRETYRKMSDAELERVATQDAAGLTPEAREIVQEEIQRRNLNTDILNGVEAQNKPYTLEEIDAYCELLRDLDCPVCGASDVKLNGTLTSEVISVILFTHREKKVKVACPDCLDKANSAAIAKTAVLGWWGIPWGIVRTVQALAANMRSKQTNHIEGPNQYLRNFVLSKIGQVETYKQDKSKLQEVISAK